MTQLATPTATAYAALRQHAGFWGPLPADLLILADADRVDFLQRMTTNDIKRLRPGESCVTVLTSPTAKIVHVFTVMADDDVLRLLPAPNDGAALERHLRGQIFFMDKVLVSRPEKSYSRVRVTGPNAAQVIEATDISSVPGSDGGWLRAGESIVLRQDSYDLPGYDLLIPTARVEEWRSKLDAVPLDEATYMARRIELGRPAPGAELTGEYNPLEAGLAWACADNKGCYTGQEIIARQLTYDKVTRSLVGLRSAAPLAAGAVITVEGREVGRVTSAAYSPALQAPVALAIIKRPHNTAGAAVIVDGIEATVTQLPIAGD